MQVSLDASRNDVSFDKPKKVPFRRPTFKNPLAGFFRGIQRSLTIAGHARAAAELSRMGYHAEAKAIMMELKNLKEAE